MPSVQTGILSDETPLARYLVFSLKPGSDPAATLRVLGGCTDGDKNVVGLGQSLIEALGRQIEGMRTFPVHTGPGISVPSTPAALWLWLRGEDRGELLHRARELTQLLSDSFQPEQVVDAFQYRGNRDLSGYEDGTENPEGSDALAAAIVDGQGEGLDGSSFVAVQQWAHDLDAFQAMTHTEQDDTFGRRVSDNEEFDEAPASAHVKRTAQESFEPEAFLLRRSMPWADASQAGLVFVAFGHSFDAFEAQLQRMVGKDDGIVDALFNFTHPVTGSYFWCPPVSNGQLDLSALGL